MKRRTPEEIREAIEKQEKKCNTCHKVKPFSEFYDKPNLGDGKQPRCITCGNEYAKEYYKTYKNKEKRQVKCRDTMLKRKYGIDSKRYDKLLAEQDGRCAICGLHIDDHKPFKGKWQSLNVDHDHETGEVRGLLCNSCNVAIGHLKDSTALLKSAIDYLGG